MESDPKCNAVVPSGGEVAPSSPPQQPDDDAIKMFVGQIPRTWDENDLRDLFKEFGPIYQINVLRDKVTNQSRGCCFITFYTRKAALDAQNALHNIKTLPAMHHPIQMKPADSENRNERKLFIGMLSKKCSESDVKAMFSTYGAIEECTVLRDSNGQSKGCAFVTFSTRQCAINAIRAMNHSQTMEGCSSPLVVKFADTRKEKDQKRQQQLMANLWNMTTFANLGNAMAQYLPNSQNAPFSGFGNQSGMGAFNIQQLAALAAQGGTGAPGTGSTTGGLNLPALPAPAATPSNPANSASTNTNDFNLQSLAALASLANNPGLNPMIVQNLAALAAASANNAGGIAGLAAALRPNNQQQQPTAAAAPQQDGGAGTTPPPSWQNALAALLARTASSGGPGNAGGGGGMNTLSPGIGGMNTPLGSMNGMGPRMGNGGLGMGGPNGPHGGMEHSYAGIQQFSGPEGANLFIYHLPQEFTDSDLAQTFLPFGNVISAKVFVDKHTNLSKCFGFVSYDNPMSAQSAIQHMNGFQIGMKRLKVQLKRSKDASKPY